jgi:two-component system, NarL family, sensor histidine kinase FusK
MGKKQWSSGWLAQIGVCVSYALAFVGIHSITSAPAHWHLYAGLQVISLLLVPYRFWGALLIGEAIPNAYEAWICLDTFGPTWVAIRMIPEILFTMPIVWLCRSKLNIFPTRHLVNIQALLGCILMVTLVQTAYSYALISTLHITSGPYRQGPMLVGIWLAGNYAGLLTLVPWALIFRLDYRKGNFKERLQHIWSNRLLADALGVALPVIAFMAWVAGKSNLTQATIIEMAMFMPAAWLTVKHGWRAAALAGTLVLICNGLLQPDLPTTSNVVEITALLCLAVSGLYALGAKVTAQNLRDERERAAAEQVQGMARQHLALTERRMRRAAERLEFVAGSLHIANSQVLQHMRRILPNIETHGFYKQAVQAHEQVYLLAESLHPSAWRDRGLPAALNETLARALDEAGLAYSCEMTGRGFTSLEQGVHSAIYRMACESIVYVTSDITCSKVKLTVRAGETNDRRWVVVRVEGTLNTNDVANAVYFGEHRRSLAAKLGTNLTSIREMRTHAQAFDGELHVRSNADRLVLTTLLHSQSAGVQKEKTSAPLRLWVD